MKYAYFAARTPVNVSCVFHLVDLFEESTQYERDWKLPFDLISLCVRENPSDPSWIELPEKKIRMNYEENAIHFTTCDTPMRIRYTHANRHLCIHFRYELFPGVDLFSGLHERYMLKDKLLAGKIREAFADENPLRRLAKAEEAAMEILVKFWPEHLPLDLKKAMEFEELFQYVRKNLDSRIGTAEMAARMGWSEAHFSRVFHSVFGITPKQYLVRELCAKALKLLNDPGRNIKETASQLGFSSEFNFSRFIKHYCGYAPSRLRKTTFGPLYIRK